MKWVDKYEPQKFEDFLLPESKVERNLIKTLVTTGQCPAAGLLFHDRFAAGGTGKSTLVRFAEKNLRSQGWHIIRLDTSGNRLNELADLKGHLYNRYVKAQGIIEMSPTLIIGEEISRSPSSYIDGLREVMDNYHQQVTFVFTDNNYEKLKENNPTVFRGQRILPIDFDTLVEAEVRARVIEILKAEGVDTRETRSQLEIQLKNKLNSIRGILSTLQAYTMT